MLNSSKVTFLYIVWNKILLNTNIYNWTKNFHENSPFIVLLIRFGLHSKSWNFRNWRFTYSFEWISSSSSFKRKSQKSHIACCSDAIFRKMLILRTFVISTAFSIFFVDIMFKFHVLCRKCFFHFRSSPNLSKIIIQQRSNQQFSLIALFCKYFNIRTD